MSRFDRRHRTWAAIIALLGVIALGARWLDARRALGFALRAGQQIAVTSGADDGPGSLREAIFTAARSETRVQILLRTPRVLLETPLPPIVNRVGVTLEAARDLVTIDARALPVGPVLEIRARNTLVRRIAIVGAPGMGVLVRASGVQLRDLDLSDCAEAVVVADAAADVWIEGSRFTGNGAGVVIAPGAVRVTVTKNQFARHDRAAVWAVAPRPSSKADQAALSVQNNSFDRDRISIVLIHFGARVERNRVRRAQDAGIFVSGRGALLRENRTSEGAGVGIFADNTERAVIERNELDNNSALGIMLRSSAGTIVDANRVYRNGYGIASVFGDRSRPNMLSNNVVVAQLLDGLYIVGGSPFVRSNRALQNGAAGIRVLDFHPIRGSPIAAKPLLQDNLSRDNRLNLVVFDVYRDRPVRRQ